MRGLLCALALALVSTSAFADYEFQIENNTDSAIDAIVVSENGEDWGAFDIGSGIPAGATADLVWDSSTNGSGCEWYFMASFEDGSYSEPVAFDFCEDALVISFE
jgi:hypothetical protein